MVNRKGTNTDLQNIHIKLKMTCFSSFGQYGIYEMYLYEQEEKSIWRAFLACFVASVNKFYSYRQCTYIVFILQYKKV